MLRAAKASKVFFSVLFLQHYDIHILTSVVENGFVDVLIRG